MLQKIKQAKEEGEESSDDFSWIDDADDLYDSPYESMSEIKSFKEVMDAL
eukprot:CAMPEP_0168317194 /NCGR_PEP_ID=MMETSP0210-20121227/23208_1 /TAXON_ID=40633 /ORGANISM="Condylostoma magnum, Strain COL2" /LENGTH=49 /DNA_ID=CAMNT_0008312529 /DNA_START=2671 /DNA_END=2820 /DNA_ORIENTATION=+